ncbi:SNAP25.3 [Trichoplax adhaerens]|uniref:SNAP25.3 n=1 Tax=Trichoplax adhaerens TaxID=10228 RepID=B3RKY4_TRIAD|nr:SNAP25.3 [Trichoplax adhaerens]EDV28666.1 SNAP25.3 [Trichoplax adhaerens]|eukprot:XP_002107868.1 SNAP25.3 [Trichoplax adhaerens]
MDMASDEEIRRELEKMEAKGSHILNQSLEITRNLVTLTQQTEAIGSQTLVVLNEQGGKLTRIEGGMENINNNMSEAEKSLADVEKCCGICPLPWRRTGTNNLKKYRYSTKEICDKISKNLPVTKQPANTSAISKSQDSDYNQNISNDFREIKINEDLLRVEGHLDKLCIQARTMTDQLDTQNEQIDRIIDQAAQNSDRIGNATKKTIKILHKS